MSGKSKGIFWGFAAKALHSESKPAKQAPATINPRLAHAPKRHLDITRATIRAIRKAVTEWWRS
jgi:hypothetical protein